MAALLGKDSLTAAEAARARVLAALSWARITGAKPRLAVRVPASAAAVLAAIVARNMRNPKGYRAENLGDYSYQLLGGDPTALDPTGEEWTQLAPGDAFTILPGAAPPRPTCTGGCC
ncbi:hypothetical protein [Crossiella sp. S99.1]|uniref:hypothetical protein n=1 Tax=Crossiella sp. S99.1 TaxID=2936271 RepID=UPI001FFFF949|nr:hypothetical protein [Crossiella sp. S99.1]MCK2254645.1 hypothetical protein [Crossiella sp. S99.1]